MHVQAGDVTEGGRNVVRASTTGGKCKLQIIGNKYGLGVNACRLVMEGSVSRSTGVSVSSSGALQSTGAQSKRRSRDSYSNRAYSRTQTVRNTGTHNLPRYLTRATIRTNDLDTLVYIGDLSPRQHRTARSSCQEVSTTTIHRPLTLETGLLGWGVTTGRDAVIGVCWGTCASGGVGVAADRPRAVRCVWRTGSDS